MGSRLTTIPLPSLAIDPVIYSYGGEPRWIFTDERFRPNGWLLLHRESLSDTNLNAFLRDGALDDKDEVFFKLAHHFELADRNITTDWWRPWNDSIPLRDALHRGGFLKAFEVTRHMRRTNYSFNIYNPAHPIWMAAVHQDAWGTSVDRERAELAAALGDMLIPRWRSYDAHQKTLYEENLAMRMLICTGAAFDGAYQSLKGTLNALWEVGKVVLEAAGSMLKAHVQFVTDLTQGEFQKIANDLAQFGLEAGRSVAEFQDKLERGMERLNLILSDSVSRSMIWQFFDGMKESLSTTNKYQIVGAIGLEIILGLATFGTSAVIKAGVMIGGLTVRVFRALCKLAERLVDINKAAKQAIVQASDRVIDYIGGLRKGAGRSRIGSPEITPPLIQKTQAVPDNNLTNNIAPEIKGKQTDYSPVNHGPLGNPNDSNSVASTFRSGTYSEIITDQPVTLYRVYGGDASAKRSYWTTVKPTGPGQSKLDSALLSEWGNSANKVIQIEIPPGTKIYRGSTAPQTGNQKPFENFTGGGDQVFIPRENINSKWFDNAKYSDFNN